MTYAMLDNRVSRVALHLLQCNYTELSARHFLDRGQRSLKVVESGTIHYAYD